MFQFCEFNVTYKNEAKWIESSLFPWQNLKVHILNKPQVDLSVRF